MTFASVMSCDVMSFPRACQSVKRNVISPLTFSLWRRFRTLHDRKGDRGFGTRSYSETRRSMHRPSRSEDDDYVDDDDDDVYVDNQMTAFSTSFFNYFIYSFYAKCFDPGVTLSTLANLDLNRLFLFPLVWGRHRKWFHVAFDGTSVSRLREKVQALLLHLPMSSGKTE